MKILLATLSVLASFAAIGAEPTLAPTADGYRGIWFTLGQFSKYGDKYSGGLGTYTANHEPMAVYAPQVDKTFFTYGGTIPGRRHLLIMVSYFDHKTGTVPRPVIVYDKQEVDDPHDNASINIDDRGYLWLFISGRNVVRPGFKYRSREPYSIAAFDRVEEKEMTYPQAWFLPGQGWFYLFTKYFQTSDSAFHRELYWQTSMDGKTWSADRKLAGFGGHYQVSGVCGNTIGSFFNFHPGGDVNKRSNLYYVQTGDFGKTWTTVDGQPLELPLHEVKNPALVIDFQAQGKLMYACDLNFDRAGYPLLLYVTSRVAQPGPEGDPRELCLSCWNGSAWQTSIISKVGHNYDMGSLWVSGGEWTVIFPSQTGPQRWGAGGEMCLWVSKDEGRSWTLKRQITHDSPMNHNYARRPLDSHDPFFTFWADGNPDKFSESHLFFCDSGGAHVWQLPDAMTNSVAKPLLIR
jgi:hypothetical protein